MTLHIIKVDDGRITVDDQLAYYTGDSALVERLNEISGSLGVVREDGKYAPIAWTGLGGTPLALQLADPRFKREWLERLPRELREAVAFVPEPYVYQFGIVYAA